MSPHNERALQEEAGPVMILGLEGEVFHAARTEDEVIGTEVIGTEGIGTGTGAGKTGVVRR